MFAQILMLSLSDKLLECSLLPFHVMFIVLLLEPGRLKNAMVTVFNDAENRICGFYPGPTFKHDRISVLCEPLTEGRLITLALNLEPGTYSYLQVCEVQVYGRLLQL